MLLTNKLFECKHLTVVSYVSDPLSSILRELCGDISALHQPRAHITLLPPRPLRVPLATALGRVRAILKRFGSFEVELAAVQQFAKTNVLYVGVGEGAEILDELHEILNTGDLAFEEEFEFMPHLTLSGPVGAMDVNNRRKDAEAIWNSVTCSRRLVIDEAVCLCLNATESPEWHPVAVESMDGVKAAAL